MRKAIAVLTLLGVGAVTALATASVSSRELGRSDPESAAHYRLPFFNFSETYTDGVALGIAVGSTKAEAIDAAERRGFQVSPSSWGDSRAGGAGLYERPELLAIMLRQPYLHFDRANIPKEGITIEFRDDRVASVRVHYINSEAI